MGKPGSFTFLRKTYPEDLPDITDLQIRHLETTLSAEQRYTEGYLSYALPERTLIASAKIGTLLCMMRPRVEKVRAFCCGMTPHIAKHVPCLSETIIEVSAMFDYPIFIQLCVDKNNRRKGMGSFLVDQTIEIARNQKFDVVVLDIPKANLVGIQFALKLGFEKIATPLIANRDVFCKRTF